MFRRKYPLLQIPWLDPKIASKSWCRLDVFVVARGRKDKAWERRKYFCEDGLNGERLTQDPLLVPSCV